MQVQMTFMPCLLQLQAEQEQRTECKHNVEDFGPLVTVHSIANG